LSRALTTTSDFDRAVVSGQDADGNVRYNQVDPNMLWKRTDKSNRFELY
jgi:hypothetical protein